MFHTLKCMFHTMKRIFHTLKRTFRTMKYKIPLGARTKTVKGKEKEKDGPVKIHPCSLLERVIKLLRSCERVSL